jgi:hypothetical protein
MSNRFWINDCHAEHDWFDASLFHCQFWVAAAALTAFRHDSNSTAPLQGLLQI